MDKRLVLLVLIVACLFVGASAGVASQAETEPVIVGVPRDFYPEYAIGPDDRPGGFGVDVMNAVAKRAGLSVTYRIFPTWSETLAALERGDIDLIPVVVITPAREKSLLFTRPVLTSPMSIFVRRDAENIQSLADLAGRRMGVIKGGPVPEWLGKLERGPVLVPYPRLQDEMFALLLGEVDAIPAVRGFDLEGGRESWRGRSAQGRRRTLYRGEAGDCSAARPVGPAGPSRCRHR